MQIDYYEHPNNGDPKWWMVARDGGNTATAWGLKYDTGTVSAVKTHGGENLATRWIRNKASEKVRKGYKPIKNDAPPFWQNAASKKLANALKSYKPGGIPAGDIFDAVPQGVAVLGMPFSTVTKTDNKTNSVYSYEAYKVAYPTPKISKGTIKKGAGDKPEPKPKLQPAENDGKQLQPAENDGKLVLKHLKRDP